MNRQKIEVRTQTFQKTEDGLSEDRRSVLCVLTSIFCVLFSVFCVLSITAYANVNNDGADSNQNSELKAYKSVKTYAKTDGIPLIAADLPLSSHEGIEISEKVSQPKNDKSEGNAEEGLTSLILSNANSPLGISYKSNETAIKAIEKNIALFKDRIKKSFSIWLERSAKYIEIMQDILKEKGMPEELVFLPIVESGFNLNAYSPARAVGPWQFIASTAKRYGLVIDWWRDERKDPVKSTHAAAEYLKDLYQMFGSWKLALAAYNAGEGRILRSIKKSGAGDYWALMEKRQIPKETQEYVPRYIAASMIAVTPEDYGFYNLAYHEPLEYDEVTLDSPVDIEVIAQCAEATVEEIRELNPELRRWSTPPNVPNYTIRIPTGSKDVFIENLAKISKKDRFSIDIYKVKKGDNLKKIAKKTGVPVNVILAMNSMAGIEALDTGEEIKMPPKGKYYADMDDKVSARKVSYKKISGKKSSKLNKKPAQKVSKAKNKTKTKKI